MELQTLLQHIPPDVARRLEGLLSPEPGADSPPDSASIDPWPGLPGPAILRRGAVHEWLAEAFPPLGILIHLASRVLQAGMSCSGPAPGLVAWIGRACWPYPRALPPGVLERSVFVDARDRAERLWATDLALRSRAAGVVIADGRGLDMSASRRLQLAAGSGGGLCLLARPWAERGEISAAWTRWRVEPEPSDTTSPRWAVELLRCKGMRPETEGARRWRVDRNYETGDVCVVPDAGGRSAPASRPAGLCPSQSPERLLA